MSAATAQAGFVGDLEIDFQNGSQTGVYSVVVPDNAATFDWTLGAPINIYSSSDPGHIGPAMAQIKELSIGLDGDPSVLLNFSVVALSGPTHVTFTSPLISFGALANPMAFASAGITVTDNDDDVATAVGLFSASRSYEAQYNGGTVFSDLVIPVSAGAGQTNTLSDRFPSFGSTVIGGAVNSIQSQFNFILSANDSASGTSRFSVVANNAPEPSTLVLGLIGGAALLWRIRRRFR